MNPSKMVYGMPVRPEATQYFVYGPWEFNIQKAAILAMDCRRYKPVVCQPSPDWVGPNIDIDLDHVGGTDLHKPLIFATVVKDGKAWPLLIDGHHRAVNALNRQRTVRTITLSLADTLRILKAPDHLLQEMQFEGRRLGLLPDAAR
jgi:hypothetical protein